MLNMCPHTTLYAVYVSAGVSAEEAAALLQSVMPVLTLYMCPQTNIYAVYVSSGVCAAKAAAPAIGHADTQFRYSST